jgi:hypothetical protein
MEIALVVLHITQSIAISLGVGCSTLAIVNFFAAIADGTIDVTERRMMGLVYIILRVAMGLILLTTGLLVGLAVTESGVSILTGYTLTQLLIVAVLYGNAICMTLRVMPSTIGPGVQAGSWYTLGILASLAPLNLINASFTTYTLGYIAALFLAVAIVNGVMEILRSR